MTQPDRHYPPSANRPGTAYLPETEAQYRILTALAAKGTLETNELKKVAPYRLYTELRRGMIELGWVDCDMRGNQFYWTITDLGKSQIKATGLSVPADTSPESLESSARLEGGVGTTTSKVYERDPVLRRRCIEAHGTSCAACGFNFGAVYGPEAEGFIHVHHLRPLSKVGVEHLVDPVNDLKPVCPNCHAFIHLDGQCRSVEEVARLVMRYRHAR